MICYKIISVIVVLFSISGCVKTTRLGTMVPTPADTTIKKMPRTFTPRDTTDTARHEITFGPTVIGWEVVDIEID